LGNILSNYRYSKSDKGLIIRHFYGALGSCSNFAARLLPTIPVTPAIRATCSHIIPQYTKKPDQQPLVNLLPPTRLIYGSSTKLLKIKTGEEISADPATTTQYGSSN
jgi:hypothetical protein